MAAVDEINNVNPTWQIEPKKQKDAKERKNKRRKKNSPGSQKNRKPDDGRPHIDEYA